MYQINYRAFSFREIFKGLRASLTDETK